MPATHSPHTHSPLTLSPSAVPRVPRPPATPPRATPPNTHRWSGDGWLLARGGGQGFGPAGSLPTYGASQVGAVLRYRLDKGASPFRPTLYARVSGALSGPGGTLGEREVAIGLSARPLPRLPLRVMVEARASRFASGATRLRPAASLVSEVAPISLPLATRAEFYAQAGYVGGPAAKATQDMGALAYATGNHVAFGGSPSLHTAAHEAAHVVQQRSGVQLKGGVGEVGDSYERNADAVADDVELLAWTNELGAQDGARLGGITPPSTPAELTQLLTFFIFTASAQHSALNYAQWPFMGYVPSMPAAAYRSIPDQAKSRRVDDFDREYFEMLPTYSQAAGQINLLYLLSGIRYNHLGDYLPCHFHDLRVVPVLRRFKERLEKVETDSRGRDQSRPMTYPYLFPSNVAQSIHI